MMLKVYFEASGAIKIAIKIKILRHYKANTHVKMNFITISDTVSMFGMASINPKSRCESRLG